MGAGSETDGTALGVVEEDGGGGVNTWAVLLGAVCIARRWYTALWLALMVISREGKAFCVLPDALVHLSNLFRFGTITKSMNLVVTILVSFICAVPLLDTKINCTAFLPALVSPIIQ